MLDVVIVGCGPRGLAVALECTKRGLNYKVFDSYPLKTWKNLSWYEFQMRSPIEFDLVNGNKNDKYSLHNFLKEIKEEPAEFITRQLFTKYLSWVYEVISANVIKNKIKKIYKDRVIDETNTEYKAYKIVLANGSRPKKPRYAIDKVISPELLYAKSSLNLVIFGSGQAAAEFAAFFARRNQVTWVVNQKPRVYQYPIPDYLCWGYKSAFGDYFKKLSYLDKLKYLKSVKEWQPSITPGVKKLIDENSANIKIIEQPSLNAINQIVNYNDYCLLAIGSEYKLSNYSYLPKLNTHTSNFLSVTTGFKTSIPSIRITGLGAVFYDGLRQGSISSAYNTAKEILDVDN